MENKPEWVSPSTWAEYQKLLQEIAEYDDGSVRLVVDQLIASPECAVVWATIDRHKSNAVRLTLRRVANFHPFFTRMNESEEKQFFELVEGDGFCKAYPVLAEEFSDFMPGVGSISGAVHGALHGMRAHARMTKSERLKRARVIANLSRKLRKELGELQFDAIGGADVGYPEELYRAMHEGSKKHAFLECSDLRNHPLSHRQSHSSFLQGVTFGIDRVYVNPASMLLAIEEGVLAWSKSKPVVSRPNAERSFRQYFIKEMTQFFVKYYGTPLRQCTLALAGVFFDCADLDVAGIAQLAPCREKDE